MTSSDKQTVDVVGIRKGQQDSNDKSVIDYRELYFQAMGKLTQMSTISNLLSGTLSTCSKIQLTSIVSQHQKNISLLQQQVKQKDCQYALLQVKLKEQQSLFADRQQCLKQKIQVEIRKRNLTLDQLDLVKAQLRLNAKQLLLAEQQNRKLRQLIIENQNKSKSQLDNEHSSSIHEGRLNDRFKQLIKQQQNQIDTLQEQIMQLKTINEQNIKQITKLQQKITSIEQLHRLESLAKMQLVQNLQRDIKIKQQKLSRLSVQNKKSSPKPNSENNHTKSYQQLQRQVHDKTRAIERLQAKISQYDELIRSYEQNEERIYMQLMSKDMQIQECEETKTQLLKKINLLQSLIDDLKISRITAELQKDQALQKYKKARKVSRLSNISLIKLNQTQKTACETSLALTPTSSLGNSQLQLNSYDLDHSLLNDNKSKKSCLTAKNKHNEVKSTFYKNKNTKTLNRKYSQVTPFEI